MLQNFNPAFLLSGFPGKQTTVSHFLVQGIIMLRLKALFLSASMAAAVLVAGPALAAKKNITIVNKTSTVLVAFYASNVGTSSWEEDILGQDILKPGESVRINMDDGSGYCRFDIKAEFDDGTESIEENLNVCETSSFTFTD